MKRDTVTNIILIIGAVCVIIGSLDLWFGDEPTKGLWFVILGLYAVLFVALDTIFVLIRELTKFLMELFEGAEDEEVGEYEDSKREAVGSVIENLKKPKEGR